MTKHDKGMWRSIIERLQRENAELQQEMAVLVDLLKRIERTRISSPAPVLRTSATVDSIDQIALYIRQIAVRSISLARETSNARIAHGLEEFSAQLTEAVSKIEALRDLVENGG